MSVYDNLVETMIRRTDPLKNHAPAPTIFYLEKIQYVFQPRPELTGDTEASVCVVISQEHRDHLLKDSRCQENFRAYVPKEQAPEDVQRQAEFEAFCEEAGPLAVPDRASVWGVLEKMPAADRKKEIRKLNNCLQASKAGV